MGGRVSESEPRVIVHDLEAGALGDGLDAALGVGALASLSRRAPVLASRADLVVVDRAPDPRWLGMLRETGIDGFGLRVPTGAGETLAQRVRADASLRDEIRDHGGTLDPYMGTASMHALASDLGLRIHAPDPALVARLNMKSALGPVLARADVPALPTRVAARDDVLACVERERGVHGALIVRADVSIGGFGVWRVRGSEDLGALGRGLARSGRQRLFVVQPLAGVVDSPNAQYDLAPVREPVLIGLTDQRFDDDFAFGGNTFPSAAAGDARVLEQGQRIARVLRDEGYIGLVGIDFIRTETGDVYAIEINPRVNTSTFALRLRERAGAGAFELMTGIAGAGDPFEAFGDALWRVGADRGMAPLTLPDAARPVMDAVFLGADAGVCRELASRVTRAAREAGACANP